MSCWLTNIPVFCMAFHIIEGGLAILVHVGGHLWKKVKKEGWTASTLYKSERSKPGKSQTLINSTNPKWNTPEECNRFLSSGVCRRSVQATWGGPDFYSTAQCKKRPGIKKSSGTTQNSKNEIENVWSSMLDLCVENQHQEYCYGPGSWRQDLLAETVSKYLCSAK